MTDVIRDIDEVDVESVRPTPSVTAAERATPPTTSLESDVRRSVANALKLGLSLLGTWAVALGIRMLLPRYLGPAAFGELQFADAFTTTLFIVTSLGIETYIRKEVTTRRDHASEFFGGGVLLGLMIGLVALAIAVPSLLAGGKTSGVVQLVVILGVAQMLSNVSIILGAMLHSVGNVGWLSVLNVGAKLAWGAGIAIVLSQGQGARSAVIVMLATELIRLIGLSILVRKHIQLKLRVDWRATFRVLAASLPFYLSALAQTAYGRIDISIMSFLTNDMEVGWYGAAAVIGGISMLMSPLIGWVILPLTSRAAERSRDELMRVARRAMEVILAAAMPVTLFIWLAADVIVSAAFGAAFEPASRSLRVLAPTFVLTYTAMVSASILIRLERGWRVTGVSVIGMFIAPALNLWLVPKCFAAFGPGGAGIGAGISLVLTELFTSTALFWPIGRQGIDRRLVMMVVKTTAISAAVIALDYLISGMGAWRLLIDAVAYLALVVVTGALDARGAISYGRTMLAQRRAARGGA